MEDTTLLDLVRLLLRVTNDIRLPSGTVVYISSLSHLERVGVACYANDMLDMINRIEEEFNDHVRPCVGLPAFE